MKGIITLAAAAAVAVSCSQHAGIVDGAPVKLVKPEKTVSMSPDVSVEGHFAEVLNCFAVQVVSDSIIVFQVPVSEESPYHFRAYSLNTLDCLGVFARNGRGPGEMVSPHVSRSNTEERHLALNDNSLGQAYLVDVEESLKTGMMVASRIFDLPSGAADWMPLPDNGQLTLQQEGDELVLRVFGKAGEVMDMHPFKEIDANLQTIYVSSLFVNNGKTPQVAEAMVCFPQVNIFDTDSGRARTIAVDKAYMNWETAINRPFDLETVEYYKGATSTSEYIFAAYKGLSLGETMQGGSPTSIHVFNWDGDFLYDIKLEEDIANMAYDSRSGRLYGFDKISGEVVRYDLGSLL